MNVTKPKVQERLQNASRVNRITVSTTINKLIKKPCSLGHDNKITEPRDKYKNLKNHKTRKDSLPSGIVDFSTKIKESIQEWNYIYKIMNESNTNLELPFKIEGKLELFSEKLQQRICHK